jgi:TIR domain
MALSDALPGVRYRLEEAETAKGRTTNNLYFHRIVGRSDAGACSVALIYLDEVRLTEYRDLCCVYSLSIRIRKAFLQSEHDRLGLVLLTPEGTPFPPLWTQQLTDLQDLRMVSTARYHSVALPPVWAQYSSVDTMREVDQWVMNLGLRPLTEAPDTFGARGDNQQLVGGGGATIVPSVFISYAHDDEPKWLALVKKTLGGFNKQCRIWTDEQIGASNEFDPVIQGTLDSSPIAILLVSQRFSGSEYIQSIELKEALAGHKEGKKKILWLNVDITRDMGVELPTELKAIEAVCDPEIPLERLSKKRVDDAMLKLKDDFGRCLRDVAARRPAVNGSSSHVV